MIKNINAIKMKLNNGLTSLHSRNSEKIKDFDKISK